MDDCIFCKIASGQVPGQTIYEDDDVLAFLDIRPLNPGHTLIIPKRHSDNLLQASEAEAEKIVGVAKKIAPGILKAVGADSFNFTTNCGRAAGQIVFHTHFHLIPRVPADGYRLWSREDDKHDDLASVAEKIRKELVDREAAKR